MWRTAKSPCGAFNTGRCCMHRRVVPAPKLDPSVLPTLDFICISHNHYDHLDLGTVTRLHAMYGSSVIWCATG